MCYDRLVPICESACETKGLPLGETDGGGHHSDADLLVWVVTQRERMLSSVTIELRPAKRGADGHPEPHAPPALVQKCELRADGVIAVSKQALATALLR